MRLSVAFIIPIFLSVQMRAQFILAGMHGSQEYYSNIIPDEVIHAQESPGYFIDTFLIDINNDNIKDFRLVNINDDFGKWHHYQYSEIRAMNNNLIAVSMFDSCFANCPQDSFLFRVPMTEVFSLNDSILLNNEWVDSLAYLNFHTQNASYPNGCGYICSHTSFPPISKYIGVGVTVGSSVYLGWIKVNSVSADSIIVEEYACNLLPAGVSEYPQKGTAVVYPNPVSTMAYINYSLPISSSHGEIVFYDLQGKEVKRYKVDRTFDHLLISTADMAAGTYFYQLQTSAAASQGKKMVVIK